MSAGAGAPADASRGARAVAQLRALAGTAQCRAWHRPRNDGRSPQIIDLHVLSREIDSYLLRAFATPRECIR